jgi:DNA-binding CsgD family transcriptional regulator
VIEGYLNGKTRDQIAQDAGISQGMVSGIIKEWATRIGIPIAEEARDFDVTVRKSGLSIKQCAEGCRAIQLLKNLGINGNTDIHLRNDNNDSDANKEITSSYRKYI